MDVPRAPLSPLPPTMPLHERGASEAVVDTARPDLVAKLKAIGRLEAGARRLPAPRTAPEPLAPIPPGGPLDALRHRLGSLLRQLEEQEAYVQKLIPVQAHRHAA